MMYGLVWFHTSIRIPTQTFGQEIEKRFVVTLQRLLKGLGTRSSSFAFGGDCKSWFAKRVKEQLLSCGLFNQSLVRRTKHFHYTSQLFLFVLTRENGVSSQELGKNTTNTPHIYRHAIGHSQNDLGRTIESRLNVGIHSLVLVTAGTEIDDLDFRLSRMSQENVLRFEIAVDNFPALQKQQTIEHLFGETSDKLQRESLKVV